jgi:hypothetical protein
MGYPTMSRICTAPHKKAVHMRALLGPSRLTDRATPVPERDGVPLPGHAGSGLRWSAGVGHHVVVRRGEIPLDQKAIVFGIEDRALVVLTGEGLHRVE